MRNYPLVTRLKADLFAHDPSQLAWQSGLRNAVGIVLPLIFGVIFGNIPVGVAVAVGAIVTGFAGLSGTWQKRLRVMLWATVWVAVAAFLGTIGGTHWWLSLTFTVVSGGIAGILVAVSPEMALIGTLATNSLVIFSGLSLNPRLAIGIGAEVMAGGSLQLLLMLLVVPWQPQADGTNSLRQVFSHLARYTLNPTPGSDLSVARALVVAETRVADPAIKRNRRRRLMNLLYYLDLTRNDIVALQRVARVDIGPNERDRIFHAIAALLELIRRKLASPSLHPLRNDLAEAFDNVERCRIMLDGSPDAQAFLGHLTDTLEALLAVLDQGPGISPDEPLSAAPLPSRGLWANIRPNLTLRSTSFRHALRLMATLAAAEWLYHAVSLPRGYWVALTVVVILKPDFFSTVGRGLARVAGTVVGVIAGTGFVLLAGSQSLWGLVGIVVFSWATYTVLNFNYTLFSVMISAEIVVLLSFFEQMAPAVAVKERLIATLIGSALALAGYAFFPTWQRSQIPAQLANLVRAERQYMTAILEGRSPTVYRRETRLMRTQGTTIVEAALSEPTPLPYRRESVLQFLGSLHTLAQVLIELEVRLGQGTAGVDPAFLAYGRQFVQRLEQVEFSLSEGAAPASSPTLDQDAIGDPHLQNIAQELEKTLVQMTAALPLASTR